MTMVDQVAATAEQRPPTGRWGKTRLPSGDRNGSSGGIMLAGAGLVVTLVVVSLLWWVSAQRPQAEVPNLVGMPRAQAEALLSGMGLKMRAAYDQVSDQPAGTVLRTDPPAGQALDQGGGVSLTLASAPLTVAPSSAVATPPVQESPAVQAAPEAQQPPPAAAPRADVVPPAVVVPPPVVVAPPVVVPPPVVVQPPPPPPAPALRPVPDVAGFNLVRARRALADSGLRVGSVIEVESREQPWTVLRTNPRAGVAVSPDSAVDLFVAKRAQQVAVPSVVGLDRTKAERMLANEGLRVGSVTEEESNQPASTVLRTNPRAGTEVTVGSTVNLVVAKPKASTTSTPPTTTPPPSKPPAAGKPSTESADVKGRETGTNGGNK
jgi:beta-lactam-binding protein with PASTA domain